MEQNNGKKFNVWAFLAVVFTICALICIGILIKTSIDQKNRADEMSGLVGTTSSERVVPVQTIAPENGGASEVAASTDETETVEATPEPLDPFEASVKQIEEAGLAIPELDVDLDNLRETVNPDIYAWIYVPGTKVNYPVLQHPTDDTHYLNYNIDGSKGYPGCIYSEKKYNGKDFQDANTVLYGHNMKNGTMFGSLHKYEDEDFFYENRYIYVYTDERLLAYKIFAAYEYSNEHLLYNHDFESAYDFCRFFLLAKGIRSMHSIFDEEVELTGEGQHVITLSTCINGKPENRFLVQGVLINEE